MSHYKKLHQMLSLLAIASTFMCAPSVHAAAPPVHQVSPNVPLDSYMYDYIEKLDGLGYLSDMQTGSKPYTRLQMAQWCKQIEAAIAKDKSVPAYAKTMLSKLNGDLKPELSLLAGESVKKGIALKELSLETIYYDGGSVEQSPTTKSTYQPLNINNNGYKYGQDGNAVMTARLEGYLSPHTVISVTPRFSYDRTYDGDASFESGYLKTHIGNIAIQAGKDSLWWGQGQQGSLLLTNNATPVTSIKFSNIEPRQMPKPLAFLGKGNLSVVYSILETDREISYPSFLGIRKDFTPSKNFTFAVARTSMLGGKGHMLSSGDYWDFLTGKNADTAGSDKWNSIAGFDFRWRVPKWNGAQIYGELYGEDQATGLGIIPSPSKNAHTIGVYIPRLSANGNWDALFETAHTTNVWYVHSLYTDGYTYKGDILGDAMGSDADRYYAKFTRHLSNGNQLALNFEKVSPDPLGNYQDINSVWLSAKFWLPKDLSITTTAGVSHIGKKDNLGDDDNNYMVSVKLTSRY